MKNLILGILLLAANAAVFAQKKPLFNLDSARDNIDAYIKMRASLDTLEEVVFYATGTIYAYEMDKPWKNLFDFEMYNIARVQRLPGDSGWRLISREMLVYKDPKTHTILKTWKNPWTGEEVEVFHVWNDPVNASLRYGQFKTPYQRMGEGRLNMFNDVPLFYPSPLKKAEWPQNSRSDIYMGAELFNFFCNEKDLQNKKKKNIPVDISWSRFSDYLPWMRMADRPGNLLYQSRGWKVQGGWNGLPKDLKDYVLSQFPEYQHAPSAFTSPNMTSWKYFKKVMEGRRKN